MKKKGSKEVNIIQRCMEVIRSFNPVTHSIDTHCRENFGDITAPDASPENILMQQIVYGCFKEKELLKTFVEDFYRDNASRVLRADITFYTTLGYVCIFRIDEMGMSKFREIALAQEPSKVDTLISYVFDEENLWNVLRSSWMTVKDLDFVEKNMIPRLEKFIPMMRRLSIDLVQTALDHAAEETAKQEAKARGEAGLKKVSKRPVTRPVAPNLTVSKPPLLPEPILISTEVHAKDVPASINQFTLQDLRQKREQEKEKSKEATLAQYNEDRYVYKLHKTKHGKTIEELRKEVEDEREKELRFDATFYNKPPSFSPQNHPPIKTNTAAILKEDYLYRRQQSIDAQILRNYEQELRDPTEYYRWRQLNEQRDEAEKLQYVAMRREQAKQSAEEAKLALQKQREDNLVVGSIMREQEKMIRQQKKIEEDIEVLQKQEIVQAISEVRRTKPLEATQRVLKERDERARLLREELEAQRLKKEEEDRRQEEIQADKIRQLRAINTVHKKHIVVFDPTEKSNFPILNTMSYMEMKERQKIEAEKRRQQEELKRSEIIETKQKKQLDLAKRQEMINRARQLKANAHREIRESEQDRSRKEEEQRKLASEIAQQQWQEELREKRLRMEQEKEELRLEEERVRRQQQYLGVAQGQVAAMREHQLSLAKERQLRQMFNELQTSQKLELEVKQKDRLNKSVVQKLERKENEIEENERALNFQFEKQERIAKLQDQVIYNKTMFREGKEQFMKTKATIHDHNPYGTRMNKESRTSAIQNQTKY